MEKQKFLLNTVMKNKFIPEEGDKEEVNEELKTLISHVTLIRKQDFKVLLVICKTPHRPTLKNVMTRTGSESWPGKNNGVQRMPRF